MKFLIPTAKEMSQPQAVASSAISPKTQTIIAHMASRSPEELEKLYKISPAAAEKEAARWQALASGTAPVTPAAQLFNGLMYRQLTDRTSPYLDAHVLMTSALYGVIPALWPIAEHRLDFQQAIDLDGQRLKAFWRESYDQAVQDEDILVSLLSSEFEEVFSPALRERFVTLVFHEEKSGQLKTHSTISKKGRGLLLNAAMTTQAQTLDDLKALTFSGFAYRADLSTANKLVFVKLVE